MMPERNAFDYAVIRVVPHPEREEFINVGVILHCAAKRFLQAQTRLNLPRLAVLAPDLDPAMVQAQLDLIPRICAGGAAAGELAELTQPERFRWLTSPRSTAIQISPV
ncbi:MAG: DUF3037 domain-containing protein, partial [Anaerolineae bacterium]